MREETVVETKAWKLTCNDCGRIEFYYGDKLPTHFWLGWNLDGGELCFTCASVAGKPTNASQELAQRKEDKKNKKGVSKHGKTHKTTS
ncbi:MAG: hypothetical protein AABY32_00900 [Nanoarchaeota archaeon]